MPVTKQAARVADEKRRVEAKAKQIEEAAKAKQIEEAAKAKQIEEAANTKEVEAAKASYNPDHMVTIVAAILSADKTTLLNLPAAVVKATQVLDAIAKL